MGNNKDVLNGTAHKMPSDLREAILQHPNLLSNWNNLTPLARNEWICWVISVKKQETRNDHLKRVILEINQGKKRPCCWLGCIHRKDKELSPSVKAIIKKLN